MFIQLFIVYLFNFVRPIPATCPYIRTSVILADCTFDTNLYISLGANILSSNSISFIGHYSYQYNNNRNIKDVDQYLNNTLIYNLGDRWMLLLPLLLKCSRQPVHLTFTECQYTMRHQKHTSRSSSIAEYMTTQLSIINVTNLGMQSVLFLQPGELTLRSCKAYDCAKERVYLTASNETFKFKIDYEKPIGSKCQTNADCNNKYSINDLIHCDQNSQTCQCSNENITRIDVPNVGRVCTDSIDQSNCTKFPQRCLRWCDTSKTSNCVCPKYTRKAQTSHGFYDCHLEHMSPCRYDDERAIGTNIRKCPTGTTCENQQCQPMSMYRRKFETDRNISSISSTTSMLNVFSLPTRTTSFLFIVIIIVIVGLLCFILIVFIIIMLIKTHRCRVLLSSYKEKGSSSSSFANSTSTAISGDFSNEIYQFAPLPIISSDYSRHYDNYLLAAKSSFMHGAVPQSNLSPRCHRPHQGFDQRQRHRRAPLQIQSPSLTNVNTFFDHGLLRIDQSPNLQQRTHLPIITHLHNGDILISA